MLEQQRLAQERLISAAKARQQEILETDQSRTAHRSTNWQTDWQAVVVTLIFAAVLFGSRLLHPSDLDQHLIYIGCIVLYYGWLSCRVWTEGGRK